MALTDENNGGVGTTMLVQPTGMGGYGSGMGGFGGDWSSWIILFLIFGMFGGWGNGGFGGGFGGYNAQLSYDFPWLINGQQGINANTNNGFQNAMLNDNITSIRDGISGLSTQLCGCCGDMQMALANGFAGVNQNVSGSTAAIQNSLCNGFNGVNTSINGAQNALTQQMYTNELANLNRSFAEQSANMQGFNGVNTGVADLKYTVATENCADRYEAAQNTRDIMENCNRNNQAILDKLCALELDGVKGQLAQAQRENVSLQNQLNMAALRESQTAQNAFIAQGLNNEVDALYNRLKNCPVGTTPVYGNQPIFTCGGNGCGCGNSF